MIRFDNLPRSGQTLTPYLVVKNGNAMIDFYKKGFGAEVVDAHKVPDSDLIMHATLKIGDNVFFLNDEFPQHDTVSPLTTGSTSSSIHIQVSEGLDELYAQAVAAGAKSTMEPADQFWGDRFAAIVDPSGHKWSIGMAIPNPPQVSEDELKEMLGTK